MKIRVGVIGIGAMGSLHARVYNELDDCELVGICDVDKNKKQIANNYGCKFFTEVNELLKNDLDGVSICTPTFAHKNIALQTLENDVNLLVEKPFTLTMEEAEEIIKQSKKYGKLVATGYIERFNPAVQKLKESLNPDDIYSSFSIRYGPGATRITDIGVLHDLGSHEIDMLNYLTGIEPEIVQVELSNKGNNGLERHAYLTLNYGNTHSHIEISWLPEYKIRNFYLYGLNGYYYLNYIQQKLTYIRSPPRGKYEIRDWQDFLWVSRNIEEDISLNIKEPATEELNCFLKSIKKGELINPICTPYEALNTLKVIENCYKYDHRKG